MPALLLQFLPYLFQAAQSVPEILDFINRTRANLQQKDQWSQQLEDSYTQELQDLKDNPPPWWKPETP